MPMTPYSGDVEIITNIGTTPQERGLETDEFKAKFDEGLKAFVEWFNDTHKTEFDAHLAENANKAHGGFKGAKLKLTANQAISANTTTAPVWDGVFYDDLGFFNPVYPDRITIPAGVSKVKLKGNGLFATKDSRMLRVMINKNSTTTNLIASMQSGTGEASETSGELVSQYIETAVENVIEGDWFALSFFSRGNANNIQSTSWFAVEVIE